MEFTGDFANTAKTDRVAFTIRQGGPGAQILFTELELETYDRLRAALLAAGFAVAETSRERYRFMMTPAEEKNQAGE